MGAAGEAGLQRRHRGGPPHSTAEGTTRRGAGREMGPKGSAALFRPQAGVTLAGAAARVCGAI